MTVARSSLGLALAALVVACQPPVPPNVPCHDDFSCPSGFHCAKGVCVAGENGPSIAIEAPKDGALVRGSIPVTVIAKDPDGVQKVDLIANGEVKPVATMTKAPYTTSLDTTAYPDGPLVAEASATDAKGNVSTASVRIDVDNTKPSFTDLKVTPATAHFADLISITFTSSEALHTLTATVGGFAATLANVNGLDYTLTYRVSGRETPGPEVPIHLDATDPAGNEATADTTVAIDLTCAPGTADCDHDPTNGCEVTLGTTANCNGCGDACDLPHAEAACTGGQCVVAGCDPGWGDCTDAPGCETDLTTVDHCGSCSNACQLPHAASACDAASGRCVVAACDPGWGDCTDAPGCETDLTTAAHCGSCSNACQLPHATSACSATGQCVIAACAPGFADCDGNNDNGCETPLDTIAHCGGCGVSCQAPNATSVCQAGGTGCAIGQCAPGFADCDGQCANGCETQLGTLTDCTACGDACSAPHAKESCQPTGGCHLDSCDSGWADCTSAPGCETQLGTVANCLRCGDACTQPVHGSASCTASGCAITCDTGYCLESGQCVSDQTAASDCGTCGHACNAPKPGTASCVSARCVGVCTGGASVCGANTFGGGYCVDLTSDPVDCGACNHVCNAPASGTASCAASACAGICQGTDSVCGATADGGGSCVDLTSDTSNCGSCAHACTAPTGGTASCSNSVCAGTCSGQNAVCGATADGGGSCVDLTSDANNCGKCSHACAAPTGGTAACGNSACAGSCSGQDMVCGATVDGGGTCVDTFTDSNNCGQCNHPCTGSQTCAGGQCVTGPSPYKVDSNTIALFHFDGNLDDAVTGGPTASMQAYNANSSQCPSPQYPSGTPTYQYVTGAMGQALQIGPAQNYSGCSGSYLFLNAPDILAIPSGTIELWVYAPDETTGVNLGNQGWYWGAGGGWTFGWGLAGSGGTAPMGQLSASDWNNSTGFGMNSGASTVPQGQWTHVAATWGSQGPLLYIGNTVVGSSPSPNTSPPQSGWNSNVMIPLASQNNKVAAIDELRISNVQRTFP